MKNSLRGLFGVMMLFCCFLGSSQQYIITNSPLNTGNPGSIRTDGDATTTGGTNVHAYNAGGGATVNAWSAKIALPFAFNFYGVPVKKFVVSKNGLLTFDTTLAGTTVAPGLNTNSALPNAALPNQTIAYFWEDFTTLVAGLGTNDNVWTYTHGTAPNRQFWVHNFSYAIGSQSFAYFALVFDEFQSKFHVVDMSYAGTPASYTGTVGAQINSATAFQVSTGLNSTAGSPNIIMGPGATAVTDNEYYTFQYFPAGACFPPSGISFSSVTSAGLTLNWAGTGTGYDVLYGPTGFNVATPPNTVSVVPTTTVITGLSSNITYDFYVVQKCSGTTSSVPAGPFTITTPLAPFTPPYTQDFTGSFPPTGFTSGKGKAKNPTVFAGTAGWNSGPFGNAGTNTSARLNVWTTTYADWLFTPTIDLGSGLVNYQLEFDLALTPYSGSAASTLGVDDTVRVVISTDNGQTWHRANTLQAWNSNTTISNTGDHIVISLIGYTGLVKFGFYGESTISNADNYVFVDNIKVDVIPACPAITAFSATNITSSTATLTWSGTGIGYDIFWGPAGFNMGTGTVSGTSTNSTLGLTGLTPGTSYDVFIRQNCTSTLQSALAGPFKFATAFAPPYLQDFTGVTNLNTINYGSGKGKALNPTVFSGTGNWNIGNFANGTTNPSARLNVWTTTVVDWMFTPTIDLGTGTTYQLEFDIALTPYTGTASAQLGADDTVRVVISTDNGLTWNRLNSLQVFSTNTPISNGNGDHYVVSLAGYTGMVKFGFYGESTLTNADNYLFIDNIQVRIPPACPQPTALSATKVSTNTATIKWVRAAATNTLEVEYGITGFTPGTGTVLAVPTGDSLVLTGLMGSTPYQVYVKALCTGSSSVQAGPLSFQTLCDTFGLPWTEGFEVLSSMGSMPTCWNRASSTYWVTNTGKLTYARRPKTGNNFLQARYGVNEYVYTPKFNLTAGVSYEFSFWYKADGLSGWDSVVTAMGSTQTASAMTYKLGSKLVNLTDTAYKKYVTTFIPATSGQYHIGIKASANSVPWYLTFDDFELKKDPSPCPKPANVTVSSLGSTSLGLTWASPSGTSWVVEWGPTGFKQASQTGTITNVSSLPFSFTGLTPNTSYDFYITAGCGTVNSSQSGPFTFKTNCLAQLSGVYTVGGTAGPRNFTTLAAAVNQLNGCGITAPVTINVAAGTYTGTYVLNKVSGTSAVNTVTFNGAIAATTIVNGGGTATFHLDGAKHIVFKNITVNNYGAASVGFLINKNADSNTIENCIINVDTIGSNSYSAGIMVSNSTTSATTAGAQVDYLVVRGNKITGGYRGVNVYGATTDRSKGLVIDNNTFRKNYYYGMYLFYVNDVVITKNKVSDMRNTFTYGISLNHSDNFDIQRNNIVAVNYGLYILQGNNVTTAPASRSKVINNILIGEGTAGLYMTTIKYVDVYNNSMRGVRGAQMFTNSENNYQNNIFYGTTNLALDLGTAIGANSALDYNIYYSGGTNVIKNGSANYASLALFKVASPLLNINSLQGDPVFENSKNLHVTGTLANNAGSNALGILVDVDGDVRPAPGASAIDIGADEYTPLTNDAQMVQLLSPTHNECGDSLTDVIVVVKNGGVSSFNNLAIGGTINGAITTTLSGVLSTSLSSNSIDTINLGTINTSMGGTFTFNLFTNLTGDQKRSNDTLSLSLTIRNSLAPLATASTDSSCQGQMVGLYVPQPKGNQNYEWRSIAGALLGNSDTLMVGPMGANDTTFVLKAVSQRYRIGTPDNTGGTGGGNYTFLTAGILFDVVQPTTIDTVYVYPNGAGTVVVNVKQGTTIVHTASYAVGAGAAGQKTAIPVGFTVQPGTGYTMDADGSTTGGLWRNYGLTTFPYTLAGVMTITNGTLSGYNYFFYDWRVSTGGCARPDGLITIYNGGKLSASFTNNSAIVQPTLTGYTVNFDASASKGATTYSWNFGDGTPTAIGVNPQHTYTANGTYTVTLTINGPCGTQTKTGTVVVQGISLKEQMGINGMQIFPNPFSSAFAIELGQKDAGEIHVKVMTANGALILNKTEKAANGTIEITELSRYPKGVYMLEIKSGSQVAVVKMVKQ